MTETTSSAAPPNPATAEKLKFYGLWVAAAIVLLLLPKLFSSGGSLTTFSLIGISIIFALSYNILLGQTGMLSFGHAVYYGLGGFLVIHAINIIGANKLPIPLAAGAADRRAYRIVVRRAARLGLDPAQRNGLCDDLARRRRTDRLVGADPAHIFRRRSRHLRQPHQAAPGIRLEFRPADPDLLPGRGMDADCGHRDVRPHPHAARADVQRGARQSRAGAVRRLRSACRALPRVLLFRFLCRHRGRARGHQFRDRQFGLSRRRAVGNGAVRRLYRRRRILYRADRRRDLRHVSFARPQRSDAGVAALFRTDLHRGGGVRTGRHHRADDDAPSAVEGRHVRQGAAQLSDRFRADARDAHRPHPRDRNNCVLCRPLRRRFPHQGVRRPLRRGEPLHLGDVGDPADRRLSGWRARPGRWSGHAWDDATSGVREKGAVA